jgi:hypothetical protein
MGIMFKILYREVAKRNPTANEQWYCQDWQCPSWNECRHHHGRSYAYAAMLQDDDGGPPLLQPERNKGADYCKFYEYDNPRQWLNGWCSTAHKDCAGCRVPECPNCIIPRVIQFKKKDDL